MLASAPYPRDAALIDRRLLARAAPSLGRHGLLRKPILRVMGNGASASDVITGGEGRIGTKWNWEYEYGSFEVEFMASGVFFCEKARDLSPLGARPRFALGDRARPTLERAPLALARPRSLLRAREQYPRNATWTLTENKLVIDWKDLGTYEMAVDVRARTMARLFLRAPARRARARARASGGCVFVCSCARVLSRGNRVTSRRAAIRARRATGARRS